jgi:hypothetical protein
MLLADRIDALRAAIHYVRVLPILQTTGSGRGRGSGLSITHFRLARVKVLTRANTPTVHCDATAARFPILVMAACRL